MISKTRFFRIAAIAAFNVAVLLAGTAFGQTEIFSDPIVDYTFELPDPRWKMTVKPSTTSPNVEYVFGDRRDGHLEVRKVPASNGAILSDLIHDEEEKLQFRQGYVAGREENFAGFLKGAVFNFEFVGSGRNMSGRFYFLKANDNVFYILRFVGERDKLKSIRNQTDSIARTFNLRKTT
jgi:hypothetical protein